MVFFFPNALNVTGTIATQILGSSIKGVIHSFLLIGVGPLEGFLILKREKVNSKRIKIKRIKYSISSLFKYFIDFL